MIDKKNKKKFTIPEAILVDFINEDIITLSGEETNAAGYEEGEDFE